MAMLSRPSPQAKLPVPSIAEIREVDDDGIHYQIDSVEVCRLIAVKPEVNRAVRIRNHGLVATGEKLTPDMALAVFYHVRNRGKEMRKIDLPPKAGVSLRDDLGNQLTWLNPDLPFGLYHYTRQAELPPGPAAMGAMLFDPALLGRAALLILHIGEAEFVLDQQSVVRD
jgi:hypothetical protein